MAERATSMKLSAPELKQLTGWKDAVIYEFLSLESGIQEINEIINIVINNTDIALTLEAQSNARITALTKQLEQLIQHVSSVDTMTAKVSSATKVLFAKLEENAQSLAALSSILAKVAALKHDHKRLIDELSGELAASRSKESWLQARMIENSIMLGNLDQEMHAYRK